MSVRASELAAFVGSTLQGDDMDVSAVRPLNEIEEGCFTLASKYEESTRDRVNSFQQICVLAHEERSTRAAVNDP